MKPQKYISKIGEAYEVITCGTNSENGETVVIYRSLSEKGRILVCSKSWWDKRGFLLPNDYSNGKITRYSSPEDKIKLFMSLFIGRPDVYAKRWENKAGKCGYSPVCLNEWNPSVCLKPLGKCSDCQYKNYAKFDRKAVYDHLSGKITVGIYPMLFDETCRFLAIDFDDGNWKHDIQVVYELCKSKKIPTYIERSRSGAGGHLWMFFSENISASLARKLGGCILTAAMNERHEIKFSSYDRLFPNQDTMPRGGFGNLIALPLQKEPGKQGNSKFVDENFQIYPDQWAIMSEIKKISNSEVNNFIKALGGSDTGDLYEDSSEKPWETKRPIILSENDFPKEVNIIAANMLYIEKLGISSKGLSHIKRLAAFKNPDFYKAQAMRLSTYNKPRIISCAEDTGEYIGLPRGLYDEVMRIFAANGINMNLKDKTNKGRHINVAFNGILRPEQEEAKAKMLSVNTGTLYATTAFGKTVVGASIIAERKVNTLILVHRTSLLKQWIERLKEFLIIDEELPIEYTPKGRIRKKDIIGQISGAKNSPSGIIDVAVMQSLVSEGEVKSIVKNYGIVIVDECHHVSAFSFEQILKNVSAKYVYGLTATPVRQDGHHPIIYMQCGNIAYKENCKIALEKHSFEHYMIPRFTRFYSSNESVQSLYADMAENEIRNAMIISDCIKNVQEGRTPIILTERTNHVDILSEKLKGYNVIKLIGGMGNRYNSELLTRLNKISDDNSLILIATGKYVGEGFDFPRLDTLLLAMPISWKGTLSQYSGRLHREYAGKTEVRIYDYIDIHVPIIEKMYQKRLKGYNSIGYKIKCLDNEKYDISSIYNTDNFMETFAADITEANNEVIIASPFLSKRTIGKLIDRFESMTAKLKIITRPETDYKNENTKRKVRECINMLKAREIKVKFISKMYQKFSVIDRQLIWYGSINFLGLSTSEETVMRLKNTDIAIELLDSVKELLTEFV